MVNGKRNAGYAGLIGLLITVAIILILTSLYFGSSDDEGDSSENPGGSMIPIQAANQATLRIRLIEVRQSLQSFRALEARLPESLDELRNNPSYAIKQLPAGYDYLYDPSEGTVVITKNGKIVCQ